MAISSQTDEAAQEGIGFTDIDDCIFWFGNGAYFSPTTCRCIFLVSCQTTVRGREGSILEPPLAR